MKQNILAPSQCDAAVMDFTSFCSNEFKKFRVEYEEFKEESDGTISFFKKLTYGNTKTLSFVVKLVLTLSYGQASVDRKFSVNNQVLDITMQMVSIIAQKHSHESKSADTTLHKYQQRSFIVC